MAGPAIKPGRARLTMKLRTSETSIDLTGCYMSQDRAMLIYLLAIGGAPITEEAKRLESELLACLKRSET